MLSYIGLYISSPILNLFVENATKKQYFLLLCIFFVFQSIYGWILENPSINMGYTVVSFMWLYLLASFLRKYTKELIERCSKSFLLFIYFLMAQIISLVSIIFLLYGRSIWYNMYYYCSPIVIIESVSFFLLFTKFHFKNKVINSIAGSCLAVYLVHMHYYLQGQLNIYADSVSYIYNNFNRISFFMLISLFLLVVFCFSILLDKIRKIIWKKIEKLLGDVKLLTIKY